MDIKQQEQVQPESEQSDARKDQLLEIYKLHAQLVNDISNRQNTTSRFYATLISAVLVIFFTFLQHKDQLIPGDPDGKISYGYSLLIVGFLGTMLSLVWGFSIGFYKSMVNYKYEVLKKLEAKLEFQFFEQEWENVDKRISGVPYQLLSKMEILIPYIFLIVFGILFLSGFWVTWKRLTLAGG